MFVRVRECGGVCVCECVSVCAWLCVRVCWSWVGLGCWTRQGVRKKARGKMRDCSADGSPSLLAQLQLQLMLRRFVAPHASDEPRAICMTAIFPVASPRVAVNECGCCVTLVAREKALKF